MLPTGFEPVSQPREGRMLGRTTLWEHRKKMGPIGFEPTTSGWLSSLMALIIVPSVVI